MGHLLEMEYLLNERDKAIHRLEYEKSQLSKTVKEYKKILEDLENDL